MADEPTTPAPKKSFWNYTKEISWAERIAVLVFIGILIYVNSSTSLVPNYNSQTQQVIYTKESLVPKSNITNSQTFFEIVVFLVCLAVLLHGRVTTAKRATMKEAMDHISMQIKQLKNIHLQDGTTIVLSDDVEVILTPQFLTRYAESSDERKEFRYTFLVIVKDRGNKGEYYFKAWYEPWKRYWDGFYQSITPIQDKDRCPDCGNEYDVKYIKMKDLQTYLQLRKGLQTPR